MQLSSDMKIGHFFACNPTDGAGIAAVDLHRALISKGINSNLYFLSTYKHTEDLDNIPNSNILDASIKWKIIHLLVLVSHYIQNKVFVRGRGIFCLIFYRFFNRKVEKLLAKTGCNILHVHWQGRGIFLQPKNLLPAKMVITHRDYWYMTGGCHYPLECGQWKNDCYQCPRLRVNDRKTSAMLREKALAIKAIPATYISSALLPTGNSIDIDRSVIPTFSSVRHVNKLRQRQSIYSGSNVYKICFCAQDVLDPYKKFDLLLAAVGGINNKISRHIEIDIIGQINRKAKSEVNKKFANFTFHGHVSKDISHQIISKCNVLIMPGYQEAFGKVITEALFLHTPVIINEFSPAYAELKKTVSFKCDIGFDGTAEGLQRKILHFIENNYQLNPNERLQIEQNFGEDAITKKYISWYQMVNNHLEF